MLNEGMSGILDWVKAAFGVGTGLLAVIWKAWNERERLEITRSTEFDDSIRIFNPTQREIEIVDIRLEVIESAGSDWVPAMKQPMFESTPFTIGARTQKTYDIPTGDFVHMVWNFRSRVAVTIASQKRFFGEFWEQCGPPSP
jgi:hypothetical protein